jgi:hypothetical protein
MFEALANSPLGFWSLAIFITAVDSIVFLEPAQFTFRFAKGIRVKIRAVRIPFLLLRRELLVTLFVYAARPFHFCSLKLPSQRRNELRRLLLEQRKIDSGAWLLTVFSLTAIALLFILGPGLSLQYGIQTSFLMVWPAIYATAIAMLLFLWIGRRRLKLRHRDLIIVTFEFLICPILAINIWKKLASHEQLIPNAESLARYFTKHTTEVLECLNSNLSEKT